jgi:hypothetical protein
VNLPQKVNPNFGGEYKFDVTSCKMAKKMEAMLFVIETNI